MKSTISRVSKEALQKIVNESVCLKDVLSTLGLKPKGCHYGRLANRIKELEIDISELQKRQKKRQKKISAKILKESTEIPLEEVFCEKSNYSNRFLIKKKMVEKYGREYKCACCGNAGEHNGNPLVLQLDHINGIGDDNRLENLRFLCPNCHSQTETYAGKKLKKPKKQRTVFRPCKIDWPSKDELAKMVMEKPTTKISVELGVSDKAVEKRCKKLGIAKPSRGYWQKISN